MGAPELIRTNPSHSDYITLTGELDAGLAIRNGPEQTFYAAFNKSDKIRHVVIAFVDGVAAGCGAFREFTPEATEVKRMYTRPAFRGKGIATAILAELERWAAESGYQTTILETGTKQSEAISLYTKKGYRRIPNYGPYAGVENSLCFEKKLSGLRKK